MQFAIAPVFAHLGVYDILVDGRKFVREQGV
jgi:hypothetical protein